MIVGHGNQYDSLLMAPSEPVVAGKEAARKVVKPLNYTGAWLGKKVGNP